MSASDFTGRVGLVTGAASGIGRAVARQLAAGGCRVILADRDIDGAERAAAELRGLGAVAHAEPLQAQLPESAEAVARTVVERCGRLDILVHSAGVGMERGFLDTTPEDWRRIIDIDLSGTFYVAQAAARPMVAQGYGRIVLLASVAGIRGGSGRAAYGAAKGGVIALAQVMAVELAHHGVTVNALAPGAIETELVSRMHDAETRRAYRAGIPLDRYGTPEETADAALFLASEACAYVTGHVLVVDGGFCAAGVMKRDTAQGEAASA